MKDNKENFKIDFVGVGAMKSATTWIYECLREHPQLLLAPKDQRDMAYFVRDMLERDLLRYKKQFSKIRNDQLIGDFYVGYFLQEDSPIRMKEHNPNIKIIVSLRNPVHRVISHFGYMCSTRPDQVFDFKEIILKDKNLLRHGLYYDNLRRYFSLFPKENILVVIYDDIEKDPVGFAQSIYSFLGVRDNFVPPSAKNRLNSTDFKLTGLGYFLHNRLISRLIKRDWGYKLKENVMVKRFYYSFVKIYMIKKNRARLKSYQGWFSRLKDYYFADIEKTENLIGRDLSFWK